MIFERQEVEGESVSGIEKNQLFIVEALPLIQF